MHFPEAIPCITYYLSYSPPSLSFPVTEPGPVLNPVLTFDLTSVVNSNNGAVNVLVVVSWQETDTPNGIITSQSVTVQSSDGVVVANSGSIGADVRNLTIAMVTVTPNSRYLATVRVTNGRGSGDANTSLVVAPEGGKL